jgi:predicted enzyme related to lactoylglutathione lyase
MNPTGIVSIMMHVPDWKEGLNWYAKAFPDAKHIKLPEFDFECLEINGIRLEIVNADEKVGTGTFGTAVDWEVENFDSAFVHLQKLGAQLYRGPMKIEGGRKMCKFKDPFGNLFGLRGK